jgi:chromosome segregation ATPase
MPETLDIQRVISTSTSNVSIDDLSKKGFKQVKVLNQAVITKLIAEAVDRVLVERSKEISREERDKVIKEAKTQFESLAKQRLEKERGRIEELETANHSLSAEIETLKKRLTASLEVQATRDQAVARVESLQSELARLGQQAKETDAWKQSSLEHEKNFELFQARVGDLEASLKQRDEEAAALRHELGEREKRLGMLEGQLAARAEELETARSTAADAGAVEKLFHKLEEKLTSSGKPADMGQVMLSLDSLSRKLANLGSGGGGGGGGGSAEGSELTAEFALGTLFDREKGGAVESNVTKVKVKESQATGVKGALAKLKKLQKGGAEGE